MIFIAQDIIISASYNYSILEVLNLTIYKTMIFVAYDIITSASYIYSIPVIL